jgi:hypothetical protein
MYLSTINNIYLTVGVMIFLLRGAMFYAQIDRDIYRHNFAVLPAFSSLLLIFGSLSYTLQY